MTRRKKIVIATQSIHGGAMSLIWLGLAGTAIGQSNDAVNVDLSACVDLESDAARYACYDEKVSGALSNQAPPAAGAVDVPAIPRAAAPSEPAELPTTVSEPRPAQRQSTAPTPSPTPPVSPVAVPVRTAEPVTADISAAAEPSDSSNRSDERDADAIFGTITALRETVPNRFIITLDNGQVWRQGQTKRYPLRVGLEVELYPTVWGKSYRLTAPAHSGSIQVQQVR